ncbi:DUF429 domain-containing protein [Chryseobacterium sp. Ch-15]|uniref:DUF429 domain-containing protein n=1 Tax=Chryseobacterium muglaense TaxID=2893752 RepID=A0A9Q3V066_9FLAO|nr:DUF429 domain-containing protein [Chryseobacterium muglaense]MBD3903295.1 DUF429 domain-containing protein [Chryseobacterium muglaense]MCC9036125.1 DUF429 domain-containing protein [Chryseobacterium muglaense]MCM2553299.1 DUF429 domain-containing protein [Chryseobacterium muglaense]
MKLVGIDGCRFGWVAVSLNDRSASLFKNLNDLVNFYDDESLFLLDMPIGLPGKMIERTCETTARKELSTKRKSSVFPIPCREAVYAENYETASLINRDFIQKGISKQTWFICAKIKELDQLLLQNERLRSRFKESHPELAFHYLNHRVSMGFNKKTEAGQQERLFVLSKFFQNIDVIYENTINNFMRKDVAKDDVIDALCLAVTLEQIIKNNISLESSDLDEKNLEMKINVFKI